MQHILFLIFSSMESFSIVFLGLIIFRQRITSPKIMKSAIIGIILSVVSLILTDTNLQTISPPIQMLIMFILFYKFFDKKMLHSLLITLTPYFLFALVQTIFIYILGYYNLYNMSDPLPFTFIGYTIQFVSFLLVLLVALIIKRTNEGYSFVPEESMRANKAKYSNSIILIVLSSTMLIICGLFYEFRESQLLYSFILLSIAIVISTFIILFINLKRDKEESET